MSELTETTLTERLDERGLLDAARGPGMYALAVMVPDTRAVVTGNWDATHDVRPPDDALDRLAAADRVAYVGASSDVYHRLCEHVGGSTRQTAFLAAFDLEHVIDVWPHDDPFTAEYNRALRLERDGWRVWCDGDVLG
jgi:hypothetical protein